jgi:methionyl-tRNA formyltransferase
MRLLVLSSSGLDSFQQRVLAPLWEAPEIELVGACIDVRAAPSQWQKLRRELRKGRGGYVLVQAASRLAGGRQGEAETVPARSHFHERGVDTIDTEDLYDPRALSFIKERKPDAIFRTGFGIIREPVLSIAPKGVISYHHGDLRKYRGIPPAFWELYAGEARMKVTVQVLAEAIDAGRIVCEREVEIRQRDSWGALEKRVYAESEPMIYEACLLLAREDFEPQRVPAEALGRLYTMPNLRQWLTLQGRVGRRRLRAGLRPDE